MSIVESHIPPETLQAEPGARAGLVPYRLTVDDFLRMIELGFFPKGSHIELLDGMLFRRMRNGSAPSYRLKVDQYLRLIELGFFPERPRIELVNGFLVTRMTKHRRHSHTVGTLDDLFRENLPATWHVELENPVVLNANSRPEPDVSIVRGTSGDYRDRDPVAADVGLIIEVAESTYRKDHNAMWRLYAASGISTYWIVNLAERQIEVYSEPHRKGKAAEYRVCRIYLEDQEIPVELEGVENRSIRVRDILP